MDGCRSKQEQGVGVRHCSNHKKMGHSLELHKSKLNILHDRSSFKTIMCKWLDVLSQKYNTSYDI